MKIVFSGGPLSGVEIDDDGWTVGARRYFSTPDGQECTYWRYDQWQAVFEGYGRIE